MSILSYEVTVYLLPTWTHHYNIGNLAWILVCRNMTSNLTSSMVLSWQMVDIQSAIFFLSRPVLSKISSFFICRPFFFFLPFFQDEGCSGIARVIAMRTICRGHTYTGQIINLTMHGTQGPADMNHSCIWFHDEPNLTSYQGTSMWFDPYQANSTGSLQLVPSCILSLLRLIWSNTLWSWVKLDV